METWKNVTSTFDEFQPPRLDIDCEGDVIRESWVFRGHKRLGYRLQPSIEREAERKAKSWRALEVIALAEFQSKARLHINSRDLPHLDKRLDWLALMQHYGVATRLLDVTYSPYVALYFALRDRSKEERKKPAAVWAFHASDLLATASVTASRANREQEKYDLSHGRSVVQRGPVPLDPDSFGTDADTLLQDEHHSQCVCEDALAVIEARRRFYNENGFVARLPSDSESAIIDPTRSIPVQWRGGAYFRGLFVKISRPP